MAQIMTVSVAVIAVCMLAIMVAAVMALWRIRRTAMKAEEVLEAVKLQIAPVIHDVTLISADVRSIVRRIEGASEKIEDGAEALLEAARDVQDFEKSLRERIERPIIEVSAFAAGLVRGLQVFWKKLFDR